MELEGIRKEIDKIDLEILHALNKRLELAVMARRHKDRIEDGSREAEVLKRVKAQSRGLLGHEFSGGIYAKILERSKVLQGLEMKLVGFQGEHGAFSDVAASESYPEAITIPFMEFADVFEAVKGGDLDYGIVPIENSLAGSISQVEDLLVRSDLSIVGEARLPIHLCLMTLKETEYRDIKVVYTHPVAASQCRHFLSRQKLSLKPYYDTAGAARMLARERPLGSAVIASKLCAELYELEIVKENIEDASQNETRFVVLAREKRVEGGDKCSIAFSVPHKAGSLFSVLKVIAEAGINLTRIESRPVPGEPGNFAFLLDLAGSVSDAKVKNALEQIEGLTTMYRFLGCYKGVKA
jgi:prephenate dehydratase/chorismate mutase